VQRGPSPPDGHKIRKKLDSGNSKENQEGIGRRTRKGKDQEIRKHKANKKNHPITQFARGGKIRKSKKVLRTKRMKGGRKTTRGRKPAGQH